jgi:hypothetical protein
MRADGPDLGAGVVPAERARLGDFIRFLAETQRAGHERRIALFRSLGFEGVTVTTAWQAGGPAAEAANLWTDAAGDAIDRHAYFGGGAGGHQVMPGPVNAASHLADPGTGLVAGHLDGSDGRPLPLFQVEGMPNLVSEWTMSPPAEWKLEAAPLVALLGLGLQGWDGAIHFAASLPRDGGGWPSDARAPSSYVTETPHHLGQFAALARAVHEEHVTQGGPAALRRLSLDEVFGGFDALSRDLGREGFPGRTDVHVPPEVLAIGPVRIAMDDSPAPSERVDWSAFIDPGTGSYRSVTGEQQWAPGVSLVVASPRTHAIVGFTAALPVYPLPFGWVTSTSRTVPAPPAVLIFTSLDGRPLAVSDHLLVTALGRDRQLGALYSSGGADLLAVGGPPLLLEPVQARIGFDGGGVASARALDPHGVPRGDVLVERGGDDVVVIDGRWRTFLYEVRRTPVAPERCLARTQADALWPLAPPAAVLFLDAPTPDGLTIDAAAPGASVPHRCPLDSGDADPDPVLDPGGPPLLFYQVTGALPGPIRLAKDPAARTVRVTF